MYDQDGKKMVDYTNTTTNETVTAEFKSIRKQISGNPERIFGALSDPQPGPINEVIYYYDVTLYDDGGATIDDWSDVRTFTQFEGILDDIVVASGGVADAGELEDLADAIEPHWITPQQAWEDAND